MNLELLESFGQNYPEEADGYLDCSSNALCCKFNRWGSLLAIGCNDGKVAIVDFVTRGVAKIISAHVQQLSSVSWSRNGRKLLTASSDNTVAIWNVLTGECCNRFRFGTTIVKVQFHPRNDGYFLVCPLRTATTIVNANDGTHRTVPQDEEQGLDLNITSCYDRRGRYILTGNGRGKVIVFDIDTLQPVASFRLQSNHAIKTIDTARRGEYFLTNSADRIIRVYDLREVLLRGMNSLAEPVQKLQDMVNKTPWKTCCLSGNGDYVCAGSAKSHSLYIWEKNSGSLVKILHGTKGELLLDVQWHPVRPIICSVSNGVVSVWAQSHVENWSAFAPDFKELEENVEYEEKESEFDIEDEDRSVELNSERPAEDELVNVDAVEAPAVFCSSDEELELEQGLAHDEKPLWFLPIAPEVEQPEETPFIGHVIEPAQSSTENNPPTDGTLSPSKRHHRAKTFDIDITKTPNEEVNPFLAPSTQRKRSQNSSSQSNRPGNKQRRTISKP